MRYVRTALLPPSGSNYLRAKFGEAKGCASLLADRDLADEFAIAPDAATVDELKSVEAGKYWSAARSDAALEDFIHASCKDTWWAIYQNVCSQRGDLPEDVHLREHFFYDNEYMHTAGPNQIDLDNWRSNTVGFLKLIYLVRDTQQARKPSPRSEIPIEVAEHIARNVFFVVASAYDDESWVGATVQGQ